MTNFQAWNDAQLLRDRGDPQESYSTFYLRHVRMMLAFFGRRGLSAEQAADLTAETFTAALLARYRYRDELESAKPWLLGIARHKLVDSQRRGIREQRARRRLGLERPALTDLDLGTFEAVIEEESGALEALDELPDVQRKAVNERVLQSRSYDEVSRSLGVAQPTARKHVSRGLAALRQLLQEKQS